MGKINVLSFDIANLIAAGEVVERPASVVKELTENAIDAGASSITVEIKHGGISLIRVSDNGGGMEADDLPLAVLRHATSKIATAEDLASIATLGFRGEALAAIAAVCKMRILSKPASAEMGSSMECDGGEIINVMETGCAGGTTVITSELFYNVPARRKFLKKDATEGAAVTALVEKVALSCPHVAVKYIVDGDVRFMTSGDGDLKGAIYSVFGREMASRMSPVDRTDSRGIRIHGYIGEPDLVRSNKNHEIFFINGRYVKCRTAMAGLEQAYISQIPVQKFPVCVLNMDLNPETIDVNVHPSKLEVKFADERAIYESVYYAVLNALQADSRPQLRLEKTMEQRLPLPFKTFNEQMKDQKRLSYLESNGLCTVRTKENEKEQIVPSTPNTAASAATWEAELKEMTFPAFSPTVLTSQQSQFSPLQAFVPVERGSADTPQKMQLHIGETIEEKAAVVDIQKAMMPDTDIVGDGEKNSASVVEETGDILASLKQHEDIPEYTILGEAFNCYVIVQLEDRILLIDKHAAHERILFDELCKRMDAKEKHAQILMFPLKLKLEDEELLALEEYKEDIKATGFQIQIKKRSGEVIISEIPEEIGRDGASDMIAELAAGLSNGTGSVEATRRKFFEAKLFSASCKAAIKGGRVYGEQHLRWICDHLLQTPDKGGSAVKTCPHGRPVAFEITKNSLESQFERIT
ncbi:MAG: DNA mismatch repair endonuclease MutL [Clostridiales bacterium]|jgi:DNA mismatch repair protein MutL|nr:DNA mismatch repair endonuclease MutL [Clostridiales bacterium]